MKSYEIIYLQLFSCKYAKSNKQNLYQKVIQL